MIMNKTLDSLIVGEKALILKLENHNDIRRRFLNIGMTPSVIIEYVLVNPFSDPIAYKIRNTVISLKKEDSKKN